jgi:regulator of protease activity HflC (stomatin/prohibitin superfamily)
MARNHFFFTMVNEGTAKAIVRFGQFDRIIMSYRDHHLTVEWDVQNDHPSDGSPVTFAPEHRMDTWLRMHGYGGLRWVGLPFMYSVYHYNFQWISERQGSTGGLTIVSVEAVKDVYFPRDERMAHILLKDDTYVLVLDSAEDKEMIPLTVRTLLTVRIANPYKALFRTEQWLETVENQLKSTLRKYVHLNTFKQLAGRKETFEREADDILNEELPDSPTHQKRGDWIEERWGVRIKSIGLINITPGGKRGEAYEESAAKQYQAEREAERIVTIARADAKRIATLAEAEAGKIERIATAESERIKKVTAALKDGGDIALTLRALEAVETAGENGNTVIVGGENPIQMLLGLKDKREAKK